MSNYNVCTLKTDPEFLNLCQPLSEDDYRKLELQVLKKVPLEPIYTWNGILLYGIEYYQICHAHKIPFRIKRLRFASHDHAISWICSKQLKRDDLTEANRKYIIGKKYDAEKAITSREIVSGIHPGNEGHNYKLENQAPSRHISAAKIGAENNASSATVYKYNIYSRALDDIADKCPDIVSRIRSGKLRISHANIVELARLPKFELDSLNKYLIEEHIEHLSYLDMKRELQWKNVVTISPKKKDREASPTPSIRQMPKFDPDAELASLTLTIPSWCSSIERTLNVSNFNLASENAKEKLSFQLTNLLSIINKALEVLEGN